MSKKPSSNFFNEDVNPCVEESKLSYQCLENEFYNYQKCRLFFDNYNNCKKFWGNISVRRSRAGISPKIPTKEERDKILKLKESGVDAISAKD